MMIEEATAEILALRESRDALAAEVSALRNACEGLLGRVEVLAQSPNRQQAIDLARAALAAPSSAAAVLAARDAASMRTGRADARNAMIDMLDGVMLLAGEKTWQPVFAAIDAHDAEVRRAALEEAANCAEDFTCPNCDTDTARDLATEIRALAADTPATPAWVEHLRPDGKPCAYLAEDACNKCGWLKSDAAPATPKEET